MIAFAHVGSVAGVCSVEISKINNVKMFEQLFSSTKKDIFLELLTRKICMNLPVGYVLYALYVDLCEVLATWPLTTWSVATHKYKQIWETII